MRKVFAVACCIVSASLTWCIVELALTVRHWRMVPDRLVASADRQLTELRNATIEEIRQTRHELRDELASTRILLTDRADDLMSRLENQAARISDNITEVSRQATETLRATQSLVADSRAGVQTWNRFSPALAANLLGLVAAAKVTAGQAAQTMREIERSTPDLIASVRVSATASQEAAQAAAQTSKNLAELTRPGPRWLRWIGLGASVAVPASQVAIPIVLARKKVAK